MVAETKAGFESIAELIHSVANRLASTGRLLVNEQFLPEIQAVQLAQQRVIDGLVTRVTRLEQRQPPA